MANISGSYNIYANYSAIPSSEYGPVSRIPDPFPGEWYIQYEFTVPTGQSNYTIEMPVEEKCMNMSFVGQNCSAPLVPVTTSSNQPQALLTHRLTAFQWFYYQVQASFPANPLWFSVAPATPSDTAPDVYVSEGRLPTLDSYDIHGCNLDPSIYCTFATVINLNSTTDLYNNLRNYTFYIGIYTTTNTTYGIWWSSTCPFGCENENESGTCTYSGNYGQCVCADGYSTLDCSLSNGSIPTQYIVLIIIASLVVASAVIGFIAWAYMQRKREGYSSLS